MNNKIEWFNIANYLHRFHGYSVYKNHNQHPYIQEIDTSIDTSIKLILPLNQNWRQND